MGYIEVMLWNFVDIHISVEYVFLGKYKIVSVLIVLLAVNTM